MNKRKILAWIALVIVSGVAVGAFVYILDENKQEFWRYWLAGQLFVVFVGAAYSLIFWLASIIHKDD